MTEPSQAEHGPGPFVVLRSGRPGVPTHCPDLDTASDIAAERAAANGGEHLVLRLVGRVRAVGQWEDEPQVATADPRSTYP